MAKSKTVKELEQEVSSLEHRLKQVENRNSKLIYQASFKNRLVIRTTGGSPRDNEAVKVYDRPGSVQEFEGSYCMAITFADTGEVVLFDKYGIIEMQLDPQTQTGSEESNNGKD